MEAILKSVLPCIGTLSYSRSCARSLLQQNANFFAGTMVKEVSKTLIEKHAERTIIYFGGDYTS